MPACSSGSASVEAKDAGRVVAPNVAPAAPMTTLAAQPPAPSAAEPIPADAVAVNGTPAPVIEEIPGAATIDSAAAPASVAPEAEPVTAAPTTAPPPPPDPLPLLSQLTTVGVATEKVARLVHPLAMAWNPADGSLYIAGQDGQIWRFDEAGQPVVVLDIAERITPFAEGSERGLLGIAFGPDGRIYLDFTDVGNDTNVVSMAMNGIYPNPADERLVLYVEQPGLGHNGGTLLFDRAGNLYIAMGDGGGSNGRDAQDPSKLLGAILRVRPKADGPGYDIPPDNPFANDPVIRPEKWVFGFRNPWRFSIDEPTGDMWMGDVGNSQWEEIDRVPLGGQGANYGWYWFEGTHRRHSGAPEGVVPPVWEWSHDVGIASIGGYVYRGTAIPALRGAYVFGDLNGTVWALGADGVQRLPIRLKGLDGFGMDPAGELWMTSLYGDVVRIVPA